MLHSALRVGAASPLNLSRINQMQLLNNDSPPSLRTIQSSLSILYANKAKA